MLWDHKQEEKEGEKVRNARKKYNDNGDIAMLIGCN
jgi:hypothetical protein